MRLSGNGMLLHPIRKIGGSRRPTRHRRHRPPATVLPQSENRPALYEVRRGDALILIGKKFGMTVSQIKAFNGLKDDKIRAGQMLKIPTLAELSAMTPPVTKHKPAETPEPKAESGGRNRVG